VGGFGVVMDMLSTHSMGGRPEVAAICAVLGQVARLYGVRSGGGGGLTDAKEPSVQAGMQKAMLSVAVTLSAGSAALDAGLLSLDEICSPEQMVYDAELVSAIGHILRPVDASEEACAAEDIAAVGVGGNFLGSDLTARRFRQELWQPRVWDRQSLRGWRESGSKTERDRVKEIIRGILAESSKEPEISEECERDLRAIIQRAVTAGAAE
jgi:trimethylamine--corrinoid protein Co-methyltransferase